MQKNEEIKNTNMKRKENNSGITLIVLIVTIVVIFILAGTTTAMIIGQGGIIQQSQEAQNAQKNYSQNQEKGTNTLTSELDEELKPDWQDSSGANIPKLGAGMVPVKWDGSNWIVTNSKDNEWFDYSKKQWANIMLRDGLQVEGVTDATTASINTMKGKKVTKVGSMFVWIPRYAYQIESGYNKSGADINPDDATTGVGIINIEFMNGTSNVSVKGKTKWNNSSGEGNWNIHPAFEYGEIVEGIWVAKFEASQSNAGANAADYQNSTGGTSGVIKIQPGVNSWRNITINDIYSKCLSYNTALNSHMMKNSEWGAVAYLAQSTYGKNSEVWINPNSNYITGQAGESVSASSTTTTYAYTDTTYGVNASTTGNVTGIYDMSGGSWEYVAAYVNNSYVVSGQEPYTYGINVINGVSKTKDVYNMGTTDTLADFYTAAAGIYGDAVYETSSSGSESNSWYRDYSNFPYSRYPFFVRGGYYSYESSAGIFAFGGSGGYIHNGISFRPVLIAL